MTKLNNKKTLRLSKLYRRRNCKFCVNTKEMRFTVALVLQTAQKIGGRQTPTREERRRKETLMMLNAAIIRRKHEAMKLSKRRKCPFPALKWENSNTPYKHEFCPF